MDLHLAHGDAAVFLGVEPRFSVVDALENMHRLDAAFFQGPRHEGQGRSGPARVLGPRVRGSGRASSTSGSSWSSRRGSTATRCSTCPRSEAATLDALDLATRIVVVANQELATVRNAARIAEALRHRYGKERVSVIITRYDADAQIGQDDVERVTGAAVAGIDPERLPPGARRR